MSVRSWSLIAMISLLGCGNPVNPPEPKWTTENPSASSSAKSTAAAAQKPVDENKADEKLLRNGIIAAFAVPHALAVAPA